MSAYTRKRAHFCVAGPVRWACSQPRDVLNVVLWWWWWWWWWWLWWWYPIGVPVKSTLGSRAVLLLPLPPPQRCWLVLVVDCGK